jgi:putative FmdB family regulatory protein
MPLYDFYCEECHLEFAIRATFQQKEAGLRPECPQCRGQSVRQVITAGLLLHGQSRLTDAPASCGPNAKPGCCR